MAEAGHEQCQRLQLAKERRQSYKKREPEKKGWLSLPEVFPLDQLQVVDEEEAEVPDGEGVHPVVVGRVAVAAPHHQDEPGHAVQWNAKSTQTKTYFVSFNIVLGEKSPLVVAIV